MYVSFFSGIFFNNYIFKGTPTTATPSSTTSTNTKPVVTIAPSGAHHHHHHKPPQNLPALKKKSNIVKQTVPPPVPPRGSPKVQRSSGGKTSSTTHNKSGGREKSVNPTSSPSGRDLYHDSIISSSEDSIKIHYGMNVRMKKCNQPIFGEKLSPTNVAHWLELNDFDSGKSENNVNISMGINPKNSQICIRTNNLQRKTSFSRSSDGSSVRNIAEKFNNSRSHLYSHGSNSSDLYVLKNIVKNHVESFSKDSDQHKYFIDKYYNRREFPEKNYVKVVKRNFEKTVSNETFENNTIVDQNQYFSSENCRKIISSYSLEGEFV